LAQLFRVIHGPFILHKNGGGGGIRSHRRSNSARRFAAASAASRSRRAAAGAQSNLEVMSSMPSARKANPSTIGRTTVRKLTCLLVASMLACAGLTSPAVAAQFTAKKFVYHANSKKLAEVLQDFAASQSLPIVVDPGVEGTVNADFNARPEDFLNAMTRTYG